jgi:hypothetical protein
METIAQEMYNLQKYFGTHEINLILGDFRSYKQLRELHSYKEIFNEINNLIK